jgi:hypothetical protein
MAELKRVYSHMNDTVMAYLVTLRETTKHSVDEARKLKDELTVLTNGVRDLNKEIDELNSIHRRNAVAADAAIQLDTIKEVVRAQSGTQSQLLTAIESLEQLIKNMPAPSRTPREIERAAKSLEKTASSVLSELEKRGTLLSSLRVASIERQDLVDSVRASLFSAIQRDLIDSNMTGPSIRRSDIIIEDSLRFARILYRNYKTSLRRLPALDPAERLGIFRARFVPFAILGKRLVSAFDPDAKAIFEVGLAFGDAIVAGDDFVVPEFSLRRLGVAFVISNELFTENASIRALALTYDFNSYGSIGVGANFPQNKRESYVSFGINKKAFEDLVGELQNLFE